MSQYSLASHKSVILKIMRPSTILACFELKYDSKENHQHNLSRVLVLNDQHL